MLRPGDSDGNGARTHRAGAGAGTGRGRMRRGGARPASPHFATDLATCAAVRAPPRPISLEVDDPQARTTRGPQEPTERGEGSGRRLRETAQMECKDVRRSIEGEEADNMQAERGRGPEEKTVQRREAVRDERTASRRFRRVQPLVVLNNLFDLPRLQRGHGPPPDPSRPAEGESAQGVRMGRARMPELPGAEFVPLEPPVTPRTPREEAASAAKSTPGQRRLSPHFEQAAESDMLSPGTRLTPGPMREWIFRDDEVSTDTRSSTTEQTSEAFSGMNSQDEESEGNRVALCPRLNLANTMPSGAKGPASRASPSRKSPRSSLGAVGLQLRGIEVAERVCVCAQRGMRCPFATACAGGNCSSMCSSLVMRAGACL
jgi:hypothetical protein